jgi:hypothetical protein
MEIFQRYNQILIWPLEVLGVRIPGGGVKPFDFKANPFSSENIAIKNPDDIWHPVDYLRREAGDHDNLLYAEYVYFHRFAQRFLYPGLKDKALFKIWKREDIGGVIIRPAGGLPEERFDVRRVHFYLFETQIAILVVEIEADREISRASAFAVQNEFRRAYSPFFGEGKGGLSPEYVLWLDSNGLPFSSSAASADSPLSASAARSGGSNYHAPDDLRAWATAEGLKKRYAAEPDRLRAELVRLYESEAHPPQREALVPIEPAETQAGRRMPMSSHWAWLLPVWLEPDYIEDDRIPQMHHVQVDRPHGVTRGDLIRLCFADGVSDAQKDLPYGREFLAKFEEEHCYDRFWSKDQGLTTRYMCCGYGFTLLTDNGWFATNVLRDHFRHHYFQLGLLAHYHRASLLRFSRRLSEADTHIKRREVRMAFADFTNQHWFREVSNQDQGRELFRLWSKQLGNQELFDQVHAESTAVEEIVSAEEERLRLAAQYAQTENMVGLSASVDVLTRRLLALALLTLVAAVLTLFVTFFELDAVKGTVTGWFNDHKPGEHVGWRSWPWVFGTLGTITAAVCLASWFWLRDVRAELNRIKEVRSKLKCVQN